MDDKETLALCQTISDVLIAAGAQKWDALIILGNVIAGVAGFDPDLLMPALAIVTETAIDSIRQNQGNPAVFAGEHGHA